MDSSRLKQYVVDKQDDKLLESLKLSYKIKINEETNEPQSLNASIHDLEMLTDSVVIAHDRKNYPLLKESFRCLRNCAIKNTEAQNEILVVNKQLLSICENVLINETFPIDLKNMLLTCLINIGIGNKNNCQLLWNSLDIKDLLRNKSITDKSWALIYNILLYNEEILVDIDLLLVLLSTINMNEDVDEINEFAHFLLDLLIKRGMVLNLYDAIQGVELRIIVLQQLKELQLKKEEVKWSKASLEVLTSNFKMKSDCILKTVSDYVNTIEPHEVALLADVIASVSSNEAYLKIILYDRSLLINCAFLLKSIHDAGKQGDNNFAPIGKLAKVEDLREDIREHPAFGFRVNMIRILGNLAWKTRCNQDEIRELDIIPLLLDCCNIDGRNPFIIQWVVFAIRNICENNIENKRVIASMNKQGLVDSATLTELGITLNDDGENSISLAPLNLK